MVKRLSELNGIERIGLIIFVIYFLVVFLFCIYNASRITWEDYFFGVIMGTSLFGALPIYGGYLFYSKIVPWIMEGFKK